MKSHLKNIERKFDYIDKSQYDYILNQSERSDKFSNILFTSFFTDPVSVIMAPFLNISFADNKSSL